MLYYCGEYQCSLSEGIVLDLHWSGHARAAVEFWKGAPPHKMGGVQDCHEKRQDPALQVRRVAGTAE